mgnify:CR=1 FL=1
MIIIEIIFAGQKVEAVNSKTFDVLPILHKYFLHSLKCLFPVAVHHMDFGFF